MRLQVAEPTSLTLFAAIAYTQMEWEEDRRKNAQSKNDNDGRNLVVRTDGMGGSDGDGCGRIRRQEVVDDMQKEARDQQENQGEQSQEGCEESAAEEQAMSDLCHMRKMERGRILYCLDYLMMSLNDEYAHEPWLTDGVPDGTMSDRNFLTDEQVEDHAELVDSQQELDGFIALAAKILFSEVYPKAWSFLNDQPWRKFNDLMNPERCILT
jgi:hypothetical protein